MTTTAPQKQADKHFFAQMHHAKTKKAGYELLALYQKNRKPGSKMVVGNTTALWNALVSKIIPATMEYLKTHQSAVYANCVANDEYVAITTIPSIVKIMSGGQKILEKEKKTIYNQIQVLMLAGLITEKINHVRTGDRNPRPDEANPSGRGKIKLVLKRGLIHTRCGQPVPSDSPTSFFADKGKTLPQYKLSKDSSISIENRGLIENRELESIVNTDSDVDKKALPAGKTSHDMENRGRGMQDPPSYSPKKEDGKTSRDMENRGRGMQDPPSYSPKKEDAFFSGAPETEDAQARIDRLRRRAAQSERQTTAQQLYNSLIQALYPGQCFNELMRVATVEGLVDRLKNVEDAVRAYRAEAINQFKQNSTYLSTKRKEQVLQNFQKRLPRPDMAATEIMIHAIEKQRKYALKYWGGKVWNPVSYIRSKAADEAIGLSIEDWTRIQLKYFDKNERSAAWARATTWVNETAAKRLKQAQREGVAAARRTANENLKRWLALMEAEPHLSPEKREAFKQQFINLINTI